MSENNPTTQTDPENAKKTMGTARLVAIILTVAVLVSAIPITLIGVRAIRLKQLVPERYNGIEQQADLIPVTFSEEEIAQRLKKMHRHGQTGKFDYFCDPTVEMDLSIARGLIQFVNPATNDCTLILSIYDKDGKLIYRSNGVPPGQEIVRVSVPYDTQKGPYDCRAYIGAYNRRTGERLGVQYSKLTVTLGG